MGLPSTPIPTQIGKDFIESFMVDTCVITRDAQGVLDDTLDPETGLLVRPSGDTTTKYNGKCLFKPLTAQIATREVGGHLESVKSFRVNIPISVSDVRVGDLVTCTASANDPRLLGRAYRVLDTTMGTHRTYRQLIVEDTSYGVPPED